MLSRAYQQRNEQIERVVGFLRARLQAPEADEAEIFVRRYFARVAPEDVLGHTVEALFGAALSLWRFGEQRAPGSPKIRSFNPSVERDGWRSPHTVVEIVNDDMPFLVDSVAAALSQRGIAVHALIHPIVRVRREADGRRLALVEAEAAGGTPESLMHIEIDQHTGAGALAELEAAVLATLADVRVAVADWRTILGKAQDCLRQLGETPPPLAPEEVEEGRALLEWMVDNNFTFLGYREYDYSATAEHEAIAILPGSGLGLLRDPARRIMRIAGSTQSAADVAPEVHEFLHRPELLIILKANVRSTVHRPVHLDYIAVKRFDAEGRVTGERRFVGLFTSTAYNRSPREIPYLRRKVRRVLERAGIPPASHDGKALQNILDTYPRDELFQISDDDLSQVAMGVLALQERPRIRLFVRRDKFHRFVSCLVYVPRDRFTTELRQRFERILAEAFAGRISANYTQVGDDPLARVLFIIGTTPGQVPDADSDALESRLVQAARSWRDDLQAAFAARAGEEASNRLLRRYGDAFPTAYRESFDAQTALFDISQIETLAGGEGLAVNLYRPSGADSAGLSLKLYRTGAPMPLSDCLPVLERLGLRAIEEKPYAVAPAGGRAPCWIHELRVEVAGGRGIELGRVKARFEEAFARVWLGAAENDGFNRLVLLADLDWREVVILRAYAKYLRQAAIAFSQDYMENALANHPGLARLLVDLFHARFDPARGAERAARETGLVEEIEAALENVPSLDEDRILRRFLNALQATLRTNYYQPDAAGAPKPYLSFKLDSAHVDELPAPRPHAEIFVYCPRVEGIHLRGGKVARGGIRWSDRREDFRTEVLGLMKAQMVKNAVIVPVGAKGGFVPKRPPADGDREAVLADGIDCYKIFISGLLDLTDNLGPDAAVLPPKDVVRHDGDDPYLVVAADKGTATFSDIANGLSTARGFWLGDAFASGGSAGYDHKKMGITARGAWELVKRHFRELGRDIQAEPFTAVGIGDMSGDVFGNGMLLSPQTRLIAAFDHRHVFIDPDPDPAAGLAERKRLFALPRSSWADYDAKLISAGGGVFERRAKRINLAPAIKTRFGIERDSLTPAELIKAILTAEVDLLWIGGIGTYVKASHETHAQVGDRANDAWRIDARDLRARVIGEGGNLGFTQRGRVEYAAKGGKLNTDAVDNSAGVDCSDHEVNIKILLDAAVAAGAMAGDERNRLLAEMTDEVGGLVLRDNYLQGQALSLAEAEGPGALDAQARFIRALERQGRLDRAIEFLPDDEAMAERRAKGAGLTRPELAVLMAYAKMTLYADLLDSGVPDDPHFAADLAKYFPRPLRKRLGSAVPRHRLAREIVATVIANSLVNRAGLTFVHDLHEEAQAGLAEIAAAYAAVRDAFALRPLWGAVEALDNRVAAGVQAGMLLAVQDLQRRATVWFLRHRPAPLAIGPAVAAFAPEIAALEQGLLGVLPAAAADAIARRVEVLQAEGASPDLAHRIAALPALAAAPDVIAAAEVAGRPVLAVARVHFAVGDRLGFDWLLGGAARLKPASHWDRMALAAVADDLAHQQRLLTTAVLKAADGADGAAAVETWAAAHRRAIERLDQLLAEIKAQGPLDLAKLAIAARGLGSAGVAA